MRGHYCSGNTAYSSAASADGKCTASLPPACSTNAGSGEFVTELALEENMSSPSQPNRDTCVDNELSEGIMNDMWTESTSCQPSRSRGSLTGPAHTSTAGQAREQWI